MNIAVITSVLANIPWGRIIEHGPDLINSAKELFNRNKRENTSPKETLEERVIRLEQNERDQAKLIEQLAERQELLLKTIAILNTRFKILAFVSVLVILGLAVINVMHAF